MTNETPKTYTVTDKDGNVTTVVLPNRPPFPPFIKQEEK